METRDLVFSFRVSEDERAAIRRVARQLRRSDSDVTRLAILGLAERLQRTQSDAVRLIVREAEIGPLQDGDVPYLNAGQEMMQCQK